MEARQRKAAAAKKRELEELAIKKEADAIFQQNEAEKQVRKYGERKALQTFHAQQSVRKRICTNLVSPYRFKCY